MRARRAAIVALGKLGAQGAAAASASAAEPAVLRQRADRRDSERRQAATAVGLELREGEARRTAAERREPSPALEAADLEPVRAALITRWDATDVPPDERRALAEALGKLGGEAAITRLAGLVAGDDTELARRRDRALLMADRTARRGEDSQIALDVPPPHPLRVRLGCRPGLGELLRTEVTRVGLGTEVNQVRDDAVDIVLAGPWGALQASRLWASATIRISLAPAPRGPETGTLARRIVATLTAPTVLALLDSWTRGPIRWRLGMAKGHQRAVIWRVAKEVTALAPRLINDPSQTTWDVLVDEAEGTLELTPRRAEDPRFAYRVADVPAASHPSVAAALAFLGEAHPGDRVWDPFCGSGVELVERARLGPTALLRGSDNDDDALAAAAANLAAAGVTAELANADARAQPPGPVDLILTNPPLGSRVPVDAGALLVAALPTWVQALAPRGRLAWITPAHRQTTPVLEHLGLTRVRSLAVDLGGVRGRLERWDRR